MGDDHVTGDLHDAERSHWTVSTKVSEDDYALLKQLAGDQRVGEWVRDVLFKAVLAERTAEAHRTILGELLALRKILLNLQFTVAAGSR